MGKSRRVFDYLELPGQDGRNARALQKGLVGTTGYSKYARFGLLWIVGLVGFGCLFVVGIDDPRLIAIGSFFLLVAAGSTLLFIPILRLHFREKKRLRGGSQRP